MIEYREIFLDKMKTFISYFVEFIENRSILPQIYHKNCAVSSANKKPMIMIINNESTFLANNGR